MSPRQKPRLFTRAKHTIFVATGVWKLSWTLRTNLLKKRAGAKRKKSENLNSSLFLSDLTEIAHLEGKVRIQDAQVAQRSI